jgi:hypothetical protein
MTSKLEEWPEGRQRRLIELWPDPTWTVRAIALELGVSIFVVQRRAKELGLQGRPRTAGEPWPYQLSDANGARVPGGVSRLGSGMTFKLEEWPEGRLRRLAELWPDPTWTIQAMARELGVGNETVRRRAKEFRLRGRPTSASEPWPNQWSTTE